MEPTPPTPAETGSPATMYVILRQRLLLAAGCIVGAWASVRLGLPWLTPADGTSGLTVLGAWVGPVWGVLAFLLALLPAVLLGLGVSLVCHPLTGLMVLSISLTTLAVAGGSIEGWMNRIASPSAYGSLLVELLILAALVIGLALLMLGARHFIAQRWPQRVRPDPEHAPVWRGQWDLTAGAGAIAAIIGGVLSYFLLPSGKLGQVTGGIIAAYTLGSLAAHLALPKLKNPLGLLLAPIPAAIVGYVVGLRTPHLDALLGATFAGKINGLALALPLFHLGAGLTGILLGQAWAKSILNDDAPGSPATALRIGPSEQGQGPGEIANLKSQIANSPAPGNSAEAR